MRLLPSFPACEVGPILVNYCQDTGDIILFTFFFSHLFFHSHYKTSQSSLVKDFHGLKTGILKNVYVKHEKDWLS